MKTIDELFEHELEDIYYAEHQLVKTLGEMAEESSDPRVKDAFAKHQTETEGHIDRLDQVFASVGKKAKAVKCPGIEGLITEKKEFSKEKPTAEILDIFNLGAGAKSERYEISAYEGLISLAGQLDLLDAQSLLKQNLQEEEKALTTVKSLSKTALKQTAAATS